MITYLEPTEVSGAPAVAKAREFNLGLFAHFLFSLSFEKVMMIILTQNCL